MATAASAPVTLRVYDLSRGLARQVSLALLGKQIDGIWHTGVLVYGTEYFFGGGGIQALAPELVVARYGMEPVQQLALGETRVPQARLVAFLRANAPRFTADTYDLLRHNCNNFSDEVARFLLGTGIPRPIIDLPNEALATPIGAMLRPMLENMQRDTGGAHAFGNPFNDPTIATSPAVSAAFADAPSQATNAAAAVSSSPAASTSTPRGRSALPRKFAVSGAPTLRLDRIVRRIETLAKQATATTSNTKKLLSDAELAALRGLVQAMAAHRVDFTQPAAPLEPSDATILQWWQVVLKLLREGPASPAFFPALGVFRVVLLLPTRSVEVLELKDQCFDSLLRATEAQAETAGAVAAAALTRAQTVLVLAVLVNGFANPAATELVQARALQFLAFVFRVLTDKSLNTRGGDNDQVRVLSAKLISNCCLAMKMEEESVITTLICGCAEVMDHLLREAATSQHVHLTLEGLVVGLGLLLQNFQAARSLSVELGLGDVLRRLHSAPSLRAIQPLLSEVVALI